MSPPSAGLFKPRKFESTAGEFSLAKQSFLADSTADMASFSGANNGTTAGATELTKNHKYCVTRLPALPPLLSTPRLVQEAALLNGYTDNATKCALAVSKDAINVWPYASTDDTPLTFEFPLTNSALDAMQLAILTRPTPGTTLDPGLAIINSSLGHVCFYESVQYAPALGMINSTKIETTVQILAAQGEYITLAENVEPAGIAVATSWKRVVLVQLRDHKGAPRLSTLELTKPSLTSRLFSGWLGGLNHDELSDEIVAIRSGLVSQHGTTQEIVVQDAAGTFKKFLYLVSASGSPFVNHRKTLLYKLSAHLEKNVDGLLPGSVINTRFLDLWPSSSPLDGESSSSDIYVALVALLSLNHGVAETRLLLLQLEINDSGVLVLSSHQLPTSGLGLALDTGLDIAARPRLYIPKPGHTAFVAIGNSIILSDLSQVSSSPSPSGFQYYEPKWEDVINFKSSVQIVGFGYEDQSPTEENPALVFITAEHGVVRIERFPDELGDELFDGEDPSDPVNLLTSHIQQAIFYSESSFVDFSVDTPPSLDVIKSAIKSVAVGILDSTSPYLPQNFSSTRDSFAVRLKSLKALIEYSRKNFPDYVYAVLPTIVEALEQLESASSLWNIIDSNIADAPKLKWTLKNIIQAHDLVLFSVSPDTIRSVFTFSTSEILIVLTELVEEAFESNVPLPVLLQILVKTLHDAVYKNEAEYIFGNSDIPPFKLWIFDTSLVVKAEEIFTAAFCSTNKEYQTLETAASRNELIQLTETLYFFVTSAIQYMQQTNDDQLQDYLKWYNRRKGHWIDALISRGLTKQALAIAQKYHDFYSIAHILEKEREQTSPEYVFDKIDFFMNQYGYDFASKLFDFYIAKGQLQRILVDCKPYTTFLEQYFVEYPQKSSKVSWIYYLQVRGFKEASDVLMSSSSENGNDNQEDKEFNYSLAKLSAIAAKAEGASAEDATKLDEITVEAESNLVVIRIQNKLHKAISAFVEDKKELMTLHYFIDNFSNPQLNRADVIADVDDFFDRFVDQKTLSKDQLISLLTVINPIAQFEHVFADALKVSALITNDSVFHEQASVIWKKLICCTDNWKLITATEENSDEVNKTRVKETILFKTLKDVQDNKEIMKVLDDVLKGSHEDDMRDDDLWDNSLLQLSKEYNIELWVNTVRNEAK